MKITVLAENSVYQSNSLNLKAENGLSLFIEFDEIKILFDTGQSYKFIHNAREMGIDLSQVGYLVISNGHFDHSGGLKHFQKINTKARVFLHSNAARKYYKKIFGFIPYYVGLDQKIIAQNNRIYFIDEDTQVEDKIILIEGFTEIFPRPESDKVLFEKTENRYTADKINHELAMLLIENDEIVLFSGCSHSGIINILDEVKLFSKNMRIKATFGGLHIYNPISKKNEIPEYIADLTIALGETESVFYAGHCTGKNNFWYIRRMPGKIQIMKTGDVIEI